MNVTTAAQSSLFSTQKGDAMKCVAARYYNRDGTRSPWDVVIYESMCEAENCPHDWFMLFTRKQWRKMGCRVPKKDENMWVELGVTEIKE